MQLIGQRGSVSFVIKLCRQSYGIGLHFSKNCMILASAVLSQYTRVTDDRHVMLMAEPAMQVQRSTKRGFCYI